MIAGGSDAWVVMFGECDCWCFMDMMSWFRVLSGITVAYSLRAAAVLPVRTPGSVLSCRLQQACTPCMEVENLSTRMAQDRLTVLGVPRGIAYAQPTA